MPSRLPFLDAARGLAVVAMVFYHFTWDLSLFGLIGVDVARDFRWVAMGIAASFLVISGISLTLATRLWRRLALIGAAAAAVSASSWWFDPGSFIFFGILHCIALSSLLAWPLRRAPLWLLGGLSGLVFVLNAFSHAVFDAPWWWWTGLSTGIPPTNDYIPIVPWFGFVLVGLMLGRAPLPVGGGFGPLPWLGRHSLLIYLVHQPILIGALSLLTRSST